MIGTLSEIIKTILRALQLSKYLSFIFAKAKIEITEPTKIIAPTNGARFQPIKGKILNYQPEKHNKVWLINFSHHNKGYYPQSYGSIQPNHNGEWKGEVYLEPNDSITIWAFVVSDSLLDKLCEYYIFCRKILYRTTYK